MNIFKILANGDGSINEANVSAFLGYLLDPKGDHGLGYSFLKMFLETVLLDEDFQIEKYSYHIFFEQGFRSRIGLKKEIIDIVILCYDENLGIGKESFLKSFLNNPKQVKKVFLIENKIKKGALTKNQLINQRIAVENELIDKFGIKELKTNVYSFYITPQSENFVAEFASLEINNKNHFIWKNDKKDSQESISEKIEDLINLNNIGSIEPLNQYTVHTIKAFLQFIKNDFKSQIQVERERVNTGEYTNKYNKLNLVSNIEEELTKLKLIIENELPEIKESISTPDLSIPKDPCLKISIKGILISVFVGFERRDSAMLIYRIDESNIIKSREKLEEISKKLNIDIKIPNSKTKAYCKTELMSKKHKFKTEIGLANLIVSLRQSINQI